MNLVYIVVAVLVVIIGGFLFVRWREWQRQHDDEVYHFRCPGCKRRLRFYARQVGHKGVCPHCRHAVIFPSVDQAVD
jgi:hypothetical protein